MMRHVNLTGLLCAVVLASPAVGSAQTPGQTPTLDEVEQLALSGQYQQARQAIDEWWRATPDPSPADAVRGHMLRGRLTVDPDSAEADYLAIALGYPTQPEAAEALLRLGQLLLMKGDAQRAQGYLQRLAADYPGSEFHGPGLLWLARAYNATGRGAQACNAARTGLRDSDSDPDLSSMLQVEVAASCGVAQASAANDSAGAPAAPAKARTEPARSNPGPAVTSQGRFAVQVGAFRQRDGAEALAARLRKAGHTPRLVLVPNSGLIRVRVGRFATSQDAEILVRRLKGQGFPAVVVGDAGRERRP
ncbi:MAG: SPOR domain-containing protein [Gemmatimonadota bacterium]